MTATQVAITVNLIIEEYPYMKTDDFKLCFKNAMKMKYGENYNRIDGSIIMGWLCEYNKERCAIADNQSWNKHKAYLSEEAKPTNGLFYEDYRNDIEHRAKEGDKAAINALNLSNKIYSYVEESKYKKQKLILEEFDAKRKKGADNLLGDKRR